MKNSQQLMKHMASMLRQRALGKNQDQKVNLDLLKLISRKQLIEILNTKFNGSIPKELNLVELENDQLLVLVQDPLYILAYFASLWTNEPKTQSSVSSKEKEPPVGKTKPKGNTK